MTQTEIDALSPDEKKALIAHNLERKNRAAVEFLLALTEFKVEKLTKQRKAERKAA